MLWFVTIWCPGFGTWTHSASTFKRSLIIMLNCYLIGPYFITFLPQLPTNETTQSNYGKKYDPKIPHRGLNNEPLNKRNIWITILKLFAIQMLRNSPLFKSLLFYVLMSLHLRVYSIEWHYFFLFFFIFNGSIAYIVT